MVQEPGLSRVEGDLKEMMGSFVPPPRPLLSASLLPGPPCQFLQ